MSAPHRPDLVYRQFWDEHFVTLPDGRVRLSSSLLRSKDLSLEDGAKATPEESARRCGHQPCGVLAIPKGAFESKGYVLDPDDPHDPEFRDEHLTVRRKINNPKSLFAAAHIVIECPGVDVLLPSDEQS